LNKLRKIISLTSQGGHPQKQKLTVSFMKKNISGVLVTSLLYSCSSYVNKPEYNVSVGETFAIYYSTNSCCYYCITNEEDLRHIVLVERKVLKDTPRNCAGCDYQAAFIFKAIANGTDTINLKNPVVMQSCNSDVQTERYIVKVQ